MEYLKKELDLVEHYNFFLSNSAAVDNTQILQDISVLRRGMLDMIGHMDQHISIMRKEGKVIKKQALSLMSQKRIWFTNCLIELDKRERSIRSKQLKPNAPEFVPKQSFSNGSRVVSQKRSKWQERPTREKDRPKAVLMKLEVKDTLLTTKVEERYPVVGMLENMPRVTPVMDRMPILLENMVRDPDWIQCVFLTVSKELEVRMTRYPVWRGIPPPVSKTNPLITTDGKPVYRVGDDWKLGMPIVLSPIRRKLHPEYKKPIVKTVVKEAVKSPIIVELKEVFPEVKLSPVVPRPTRQEVVETLVQGDNLGFAKTRQNIKTIEGVQAEAYKLIQTEFRTLYMADSLLQYILIRNGRKRLEFSFVVGEEEALVRTSTHFIFRVVSDKLQNRDGELLDESEVEPGAFTYCQILQVVHAADEVLTLLQTLVMMIFTLKSDLKWDETNTKIVVRKKPLEVSFGMLACMNTLRRSYVMGMDQLLCKKGGEPSVYWETILVYDTSMNISDFPVESNNFRVLVVDLMGNETMVTVSLEAEGVEVYTEECKFSPTKPYKWVYMKDEVKRTWYLSVMKSTRNPVRVQVDVMKLL